MGMVAMIFVTIFCVSKWMKWKVATLSLAYYIKKNQYKQPSDDELKKCIDFVVRNMIKDLTL